MKYKLVCIDLDGTLLNSKRRISEASKKILKKAEELGIYIVITTGRTFLDAKDYSNLIGLNSPIIACTGAIVKEKHEPDIIYKSTIDEELSRKLLIILKKYNAKPIFNSLSKTYCGNLIVATIMRYLKFKGYVNKSVKIEFVKNSERWDEVFHSEKNNIVKCEIISRSKNKINSLRKELLNMNSIEITSSSNHNIEITTKGTSKGNAIKILADHYKIKKEEIIAIGDSENDLSAIEFAGMGIAMGNASDVVKEISNFITDTNDNDGVAKAIEKFIFSEY